LSKHPEPDFENEEPYCLRRRCIFLNATVLKIMASIVLTTTSSKGKWFINTTLTTINYIVIIKDECVPPVKLKLVIVIEVYPRVDEVVRVVTISSSSGSEMKRLTVKLYVLPTEADAISVKNQNVLTGGLVEDNGTICSLSPQKAIPRNRRTRNNINRQ